MNALSQRGSFAQKPSSTFVFSPVRGRNGAKSFELGAGDRAGIPMGMKNPSLTTTEIEFCGWLAQAESGAILEYHRGYLALDVTPGASRLPDRERAELARVASRAWWAAQQGLVHLLQRRYGCGDYSYLLIARPRSASKPVSKILSREAV